MTLILGQEKCLHFFACLDKLIRDFLWDQDIIRSDAGLNACENSLIGSDEDMYLTRVCNLAPNQSPGGQV
jgi:hypothetical protein